MWSDMKYEWNITKIVKGNSQISQAVGYRYPFSFAENVGIISVFFLFFSKSGLACFGQALM